MQFFRFLLIYLYEKQSEFGDIAIKTDDVVAAERDITQAQTTT